LRIVKAPPQDARGPRGLERETAEQLGIRGGIAVERDQGQVLECPPRRVSYPREATLTGCDQKICSPDARMLMLGRWRP